ncbi:MAG: DedA family protein [Prevotellaceae bacterium]|jgi:membrane protein YqaA with SNARE-associated domain|nr:DedA family protein [Prevotellaceae bacterium]
MIEWFVEYGYVGLFLLSFLAATILPFSSEAIFWIMIVGGYNACICVFVATAGNFLGGLTCYYIGRFGKIEWIEKFLRIEKSKMERWTNKVRKYGGWFAFFAFAPIVGDAIAVTTGYLRCNLATVIPSMLAGKFARYLFIMYANYELGLWAN